MSKPDYAKVCQIAIGEVGYLEKKSNASLDSKTANAGYNNWTKYGRDMHKLYPAVMDLGAPWCDCFVDWCVWQGSGKASVDAKTALCGNFDDYTVQSADYYKAKGRWGTRPKLGAQIFFKNGSGICHTGIVVGYDGTYVYTVEGNTSASAGVVANGGGVAAKRYTLENSRIAGYGYPKYAEEPLTTGAYVLKKNAAARADAKRTATKVQDLKKGDGIKVTSIKVNSAGNVWGYAANKSGWVCLRGGLTKNV